MIRLMSKESLSGASEQVDAQEALGTLIKLIAFDERGPRDKRFFGSLLAMLHDSGVGFDMTKVTNEIHTKTQEILAKKVDLVDLPPDATMTLELRKEILDYTSYVRRTLDAIEEVHVQAVVNECDTPEKLRAVEAAIRILAKPEMMFRAGEAELPILGFVDVVSGRVKTALES